MARHNILASVLLCKAKKVSRGTSKNIREKIMAINLIEYDYDTKASTRRMIIKLKKENPKKFREMYFRWLQRVYQKARKYCPVDTGALRASIRIVAGDNPLTGPKMTSGDKYIAVVGGKMNGGQAKEEQLWIVAGGGGYINPKKGREVDYAAAVHDKKPFLAMAMSSEMKTLHKWMEDHLKWVGKVWTSDVPSIGGMWKLPTALAGKYSSIVY